MFSNEINLLGVIADSRAGQGKYKMNLEYLSIPKSKEVLKKDGNPLEKTWEPS